MRRLAWAFAGRLCDKYHNLMSCLICHLSVRVLSVISDEAPNNPSNGKLSERQLPLDIHISIPVLLAGPWISVLFSYGLLILAGILGSNNERFFRTLYTEGSFVVWQFVYVIRQDVLWHSDIARKSRHYIRGDETQIWRKILICALRPSTFNPSLNLIYRIWRGCVCLSRKFIR